MTAILLQRKKGSFEEKCKTLYPPEIERGVSCLCSYIGTMDFGCFGKHVKTIYSFLAGIPYIGIEIFTAEEDFVFNIICPYEAEDYVKEFAWQLEKAGVPSKLDAIIPWKLPKRSW